MVMVITMVHGQYLLEQQERTTQPKIPPTIEFPSPHHCLSRTPHHPTATTSQPSSQFFPPLIQAWTKAGKVLMIFTVSSFSHKGSLRRSQKRMTLHSMGKLWTAFDPLALISWKYVANLYGRYALICQEMFWIVVLPILLPTSPPFGVFRQFIHFWERRLPSCWSTSSILSITCMYCCCPVPHLATLLASCQTPDWWKQIVLHAGGNGLFEAWCIKADYIIHIYSNAKLQYKIPDF